MPAIHSTHLFNTTYQQIKPFKRDVTSVRRTRTIIYQHKAANAVVSSSNSIALKEWAPTIAALEDGNQIMLLRKGGIKEPTFKPPASQFILFPTSFHTTAELLTPEYQALYAKELQFDPKASPELVFTSFANVTGAWTTLDPAVINLNGHIWTPAFLENRLRWRPNQAISILETRIYKLKQPLVIKPTDEMWGCFSFVDLPVQLSPNMIQEAIPALEDDAFKLKQQELRAQLSKLQDVQPLKIDS